MKEQTKKYIENIDNYLITTYGEVKPEWEMIISILGDTYDEYLEMQEIIKETGLYNPQTGRKNPLIASVKDARATIFKLTQHLGISPYADAKIKVPDCDDTEDYITNLTNG